MAVAIRDYLRSRGYNDDDITYDNGTVMLKNKRYASATPSADGRTYANENQLAAADNSYDMRDALDQYRQNLNKPKQEFKYDVNTDPQYQSALQAAKASGEQQAGNLAAYYNKKGIMNSTINSNAGQAAAQAETARVNTQLLPQLISQAYTKFRDDQNAEANQNDKRLQYAMTLNGLGQQQFQNDRSLNAEERQRQQDHINLANQLSQEYGVHVDPKDDPSLAYAQIQGLTPLSTQQFQQQKAAQDAGFTGYYQGQPTMQKNAQDFGQTIQNKQLAIQQQNANTSAARASGSGSSSVTQQRYNDQQSQRGFEGQVMDELSQLEPTEYEGWLEANRGEITRQLGTSGFEQIKKSVTSSTQKQSTQETSLRKQAIALANKDPDWYDESKREALIQEYMDYLK